MRKTKIKKNDLVLIEWEDSVLGFQGWKIIRDQPTKPTMFYSVGFIIKSGKRFTVLYPHMEVERSKARAGAGDIIIPNSAIRKIFKLKY